MLVEDIIGIQPAETMERVRIGGTTKDNFRDEGRDIENEENENAG